MREPARSPEPPDVSDAPQDARIAAERIDASREKPLELTDAELLRCDLSNVHAPGSTLVRVAISDGRLTGLALTESRLRDVTIDGCRADLASFAYSGLERVTFSGCALTQTDFLDATLADVRFDACDLSGADFRGARMTRCELRRCELDGIVGVEGLRGAALEWPAIVGLTGALAAALGIEALDDQE
jgi:uncharacterized protein YjbI with pentapeptide repeats